MDLAWIVLLIIPAMVLIAAAHLYAMQTYRRFHAIGAGAGLTGAQIARELLDRHGLSDVGIQEIHGVLSDRYDLRARKVQLSKENYRSTSIAALGIAAHEIGHVIQDRQETRRLTLRLTSWLIRIAGWGSVIGFLCLFIGVLSQWTGMATTGVLLFTGAVACSLLTLPVELNASRQALALLGAGGYLTEAEMNGARAVLRAAAWSYMATAGTMIFQAVRDFVKRDDD